MSKSDPPPFALPVRYKYEGLTLSGGQGKVYICLDANLERQVAIKALHTVSKLGALLKEIEARGKIKSKHVVELYDVLIGADGKPFALVLEYVPGESLQNTANLPNAVPDKLLLLYQLACGLTEIHAANVIHRDIKPDNIKLNADGVLKIFDLGIANLDADSASTLYASGTAVYLAPELYNTAPLVVTRAADIYALGIVSWFVLGFAKFPSALLEWPPQKSGTAVPSLATAVPALAPLVAVLDRMLSVDPANRPAASEIKSALAELILQGKKRGFLAIGDQTWGLSKVGQVTKISLDHRGTLDVAYTGFKFVVRALTGSVYINNRPIAIGDELPPSCVLTFGDASMGAARGFVAFNASQPEIVL
jgi:eukaryotic-like serine/threonine-protein kinase